MPPAPCVNCCIRATGCGNLSEIRQVYAMVFTRADSLDILRLAVFLCKTPLVAARAISGCAVLRAAAAASLSPDAIASSTLRIWVLVRDRREVLTNVRCAIFRTIFFADLVFAIDHSLSNLPIG